MKLNSISTRAPKALNKAATKVQTLKLATEIGDLQNILYAQAKYKVLIILQGMDASGKDGTIKNVFKGINPLGCRVQAFKAPTEEERRHDFLWRIHGHVPQNGMIQIFNRSHYEDILVPSVYAMFDKEILERRYEHINNFERLLADANTLVIKFYLHISKAEQAGRLAERQTNPRKHWKHDDRDAIESKSWDKYMKVYEKIFDRCNSPFAWNIIPADQNWYRDFLVAKTIVKELKKLKLEFPPLASKK